MLNKVMIITILFLYVSGQSAFPFKSNTYNTKGRLSFINKRYDFGVIKKDTILTAKYIFTNTGDENVMIESVNPDCTCTSYKLSKSIISPGDSAYIELKYDSHNKYGIYKIYSTVKANTPEQLYKLVLKVNVDTEL